MRSEQSRHQRTQVTNIWVHGPPWSYKSAGCFKSLGNWIFLEGPKRKTWAFGDAALTL